ncbi:MAG: cation diffusion facilitator family transporter [Candidatus Bathyarchaeia archaeon]
MHETTRWPNRLQTLWRQIIAVGDTPAFLSATGNLGSSVGILVGGVIIYFWKIYLLDPIMTIALTVFILYNVTKNLKEAINILMQGVPKHINLEAVKQDILAVKGVVGLHDIHIWSLEGETDVFTAHVVLDDETLRSPEPTKQTIKETLQKHHIEHSTIELESKYKCSGMVCEEQHKDHK